MEKISIIREGLAEKKRFTVYYGWIILAVGFVNLGISFGIWYSFSVFFLALIQEFGWSHGAASSVFSFFLISQAVVGLLAGHLQDRYGPRFVIPLGAVILALSLVLSSRIETIGQFRFSFGVMSGAGIGLIAFTSHAAFIPRWFERRRGFAMGIASSGIGFGMLLIPIIEKVITLFGWRTTYLLLAALVFFVIGPLNALLSRRCPADMNLLPDGDHPGMIQTDRPPKMVMQVMDADWAAEEWTLRKAITTKRFWFVLLSFFFGSYWCHGTLLHAVSAMVDGGLSRANAAYYVGILGVTGSGSKLLCGYLSDRIGREKVYTMASFLTAGGLVCLMFTAVSPKLMPILFAILFGLGYGSWAPIIPSVSADIFQGRSFGLVFSVIGIGGGVGGALGSFLSGVVRDVSGAYSISLILLIVSAALSVSFVWLAGPRKVRRMVKV
jgi:MFS family permease